MTSIAIEKRVKWKTLSQIVNIGKDYYDKYVKLIVIMDEKEKINNTRLDARKSSTKYNSVDDLFSKELGKDVYDKIIN